ncbi:MAG: GvpL/GvpF family gas vesicle protein, partial [Chloroflexota bacterium]|nr:GvpL/GvpF family gas vesicle protein [Chloroflexota bacterium]
MNDDSDPFQGLPLNIPDELIAEIFHQAWAEALAEARRLLKQKMLQTILDRALASSPSLFSPIPEITKPAATIAASPLADQVSFETEELIRDGEHTKPIAPITPSADDRVSSADAKRIQQEIEGIRQKLGHNEELLQQIKTPPARPANPGPAARDESPVVALDSKGYYVYCVEVNDSSHLRQQELPQDTPAGVRKPQGIDPAYPLYTIADQTLRAVVSQVSLQEFGEAPLELNLHNSAWLESRVRCHQDVLETISLTS